MISHLVYSFTVNNLFTEVKQVISWRNTQTEILIDLSSNMLFTELTNGFLK